MRRAKASFARQFGNFAPEYESGYVCLSPVGEKPPAPPPEILESARYEAEERSKNPDWDLPPSALN